VSQTLATKKADRLLVGFFVSSLHLRDRLQQSVNHLIFAPHLVTQNIDFIIAKVFSLNYLVMIFGVVL
jgi:hypothetical protein